MVLDTGTTPIMDLSGSIRGGAICRTILSPIWLPSLIGGEHMKETTLNYIEKDKHITFCSSEKRWINKITKLHTKHPDEVRIIYTAEDNHGMIYAELPVTWLKISPPRQVNYTEEQRAAMAERLAAARNKQEG